MIDVPQNLQLIIVAVISAIGTYFGHRITANSKRVELNQTEQSEFLQTILKRLDDVQNELDSVWEAMENVREENRNLKSQNELKDIQISEYLRVLNRVASCQCTGCPNASRAREFFNIPGGTT